MSYTESDRIRDKYKSGEPKSREDIIRLMHQYQKDIERWKKMKDAAKSKEAWEEYAPASKGKTTDKDLEANKKTAERNIEYWQGLVDGMSETIGYGDYSIYLERAEPEEFERVWGEKSRYASTKRKKMKA